jgi:Tfp pilus assembly protein PilF
MNNLGILLMKQGRLDESEEMFVRVLSIDPNFGQSQAMLKKLRRR